MGYFYCLNLLRKIPAGTLLINEHVIEPFSFSARGLDHMTDSLRRRKALLAELLPWEEPNYGIDERWVRFSPYGSKARPGRNVQVSLKTFNHSNASRTLTAALNLPAGFNATRPAASIAVPPRAEKQLDFNLVVDSSIKPGTYVITADVKQEQWNLHQWTEAIIEVE
jgi:hypothetical protein